jgi:hypothetical protein
MTKAGDTREDVISRLGPHEWLRRFVVDGQVSVNGGFEIAGAAMDPAPQLLLSEQREQRSTRLIHEAVLRQNPGRRPSG